jgi:HAD superfamily hydrolase (TIGR01458 family)
VVRVDPPFHHARTVRILPDQATVGQRARQRGIILEMEIEGVLLDIDGTLVVSWEQVPGAAEAIAWLRDREIPFRLVTNTTSQSRKHIAASLVAVGIQVKPEDIITAVVATASYLRIHHTGAKVFLLSDEGSIADLGGAELAEEGAEVVVVGGAGPKFSYEKVNRAFQMVTAGVPLVAMHRSLYWKTSEGLRLDGGAYVRAVEEAAGVRAAVCGKPAETFFETSCKTLGIPAERVAIVGDDVVTDVLGGQAVGLTGLLVKTGKFRPSDLDRSEGIPDYVIESVADLPTLPVWS